MTPKRIKNKLNSLLGRASRPEVLTMKEITGNQIAPNIQKIIASARYFIENAAKRANAKFTVDENDQLVVSVNNINLFMECEEDLYIINEIFVENCYEFYTNSNDIIVIDIGLNIGTASLYFNSLKNVKKIYAFEPLPLTYKKCLRNFGINQDVSKVEHHNFGLGKKNEKAYFDYDESVKGSVGLYKSDFLKQRAEKPLKRTEVEIKEASSIISNIIAQHPEATVVVKMDCEGGEYEIIPNLYESGIIKQINMLIMEWHGNDFFKNLSCFDEFNCFINKKTKDTGMLYASLK